MNLSDSERRRVVEYLLQDAKDYETINQQLAKLPGMEAFINHNKAVVAAERLVATRLLDTEPQII